MENENDDLEDLVGKLKRETEAKNEEIKWLKTLVSHRENQIRSKVFSPAEKKSHIPKIAFITTVAIVAVAGAFAAYTLFFSNNETERSASANSPSNLADRAAAYTDSAMLANQRDLERIKNNQVEIDSIMRVKSLKNDSAVNPDNVAKDIDSRQLQQDIAKNDAAVNNAAEKNNSIVRNEEINKPDPVKKPDPVPVRKTAAIKPQKRKPDPKPVQNNRETSTEQAIDREFEDEPPVVKRDKYALAVGKAYFYIKPDVTAKAPAVLLNSSNVELTAVEDTNGFIRVSFFNTQGTITEGWLRKQDLRKLY